MNVLLLVLGVLLIYAILKVGIWIVLACMLGVITAKVLRKVTE